MFDKISDVIPIDVISNNMYILVCILILSVLIVVGLVFVFLKLTGISPKKGKGEEGTKKPKKEKRKKGRQKNSDKENDNKGESKEDEPAGSKDDLKKDKNLNATITDEEADALTISVASLNEKKANKKNKKQKEKNKAAKPLSPKKKLKKAKKQAKKIKIPRTVQDSIPYEQVYEEDGIIETSKGVFTKSYLLKDVNYQIAKPKEQEEMFQKYGDFLNGFDPTTHFELSIIQKKINMNDFESKVMLKDENDGLDDLRHEYNDLIKSNLLEGRNNLSKEKYLTVSIKATSFSEAQAKFAKIDSEINSDIKKIGNSSATVVPTAKRLEILHDIYNDVEDSEFCNNYVRNEKGQFVPAEEKFSFKLMRQAGLTTKDMIGPASMKFDNDYGRLGDKYFRALYLRTLPTFLEDTVLRDITDTDCNMITSMYFEPVDPQEAIKLARNQQRNINASLSDRQQKNAQKLISPELISPELRDAYDEANELLRDLTGKNQKLFYTTFVIVHFADTKEQLELDTKSIMDIGRSLVCDIKKLTYQQENGLNTALPLGLNQLFVKRSLTTESAAVFMPFVNQELSDTDGGLFYGTNSISGNLALFDRTKRKNANGFIFGQPGSGKSMAAKLEAFKVYIARPKDRVIIVDPEGEYGPLAKLLGGEIIRISPGKDVHINPFDLEMNYKSEDDPMAIKSDFIASLCETISGDRFGITQVQRSIIDRCVNQLYRPYLESRNPETNEYDKSKLPTLVDFYNLLREQRGYDAMQLADGLEMYVTGSFNFFAHRTNVEYTKRFVVYDIKDIGNNMTALGLQVVLDNIWNQVVAGRNEGRYTWFFADEIHLLFRNRSSASFLRDLYKRARKYGGIPTGITQNVSDLLRNEYVETIIANCEYIMMLSQAATDRAELGTLFNMSATEMEKITNANPGEGLIYDGAVMVPFTNKLPKNTRMYEVMTTKLDEVQEREKAQKETNKSENEEKDNPSVLSSENLRKTV